MYVKIRVSVETRVSSVQDGVTVIDFKGFVHSFNHFACDTRWQ